MNALLAPEPLPVALSAEKTAMLARLAEGLAPEELYWVAAWSSARAGQAQRGLRPAEAMPSSRSDAPRLTILFGSQSGNARRVAEQPAARSGAAGLPVRLLRADAYPQRWLACETHLLIVISTQGDGEPPDDARGFVEFPSSRRPGASRDGPARVRPARSRPGTAASSRWATGQAQQDPRIEQAVPRQLASSLSRIVGRWRSLPAIARPQVGSATQATACRRIALCLR